MSSRPLVKIAFASGTDELNARLIEKMRGVFPELPLYVVSEFAPEEKNCVWVRYQQGRFLENFGRCRYTFRDKKIRLAGVLLVPNVPFRAMRLIAFALSPLYFLAVNEHLNDFMLRPGSLPTIVRHFLWRAGNLFRWRFGGDRPPSQVAEASPEPATPRISAHPGIAPSGKPVILIASPYMPFPLSHGGAVRIYNLMKRAAAEFDQVLVTFAEDDGAPPAEIAALCVEAVTVRRTLTHSLPYRGRPEMVEEFHSPDMETALRQAVGKWRPAVAQLEFTWMAQYAPACRPARTILVEHDITYDLYDQMVNTEGGFDNVRQARLWRRFETRAWGTVDRVVTMSEKDRLTVASPKAATLANGVDLERFQPAAEPPDPRRLLFIGSFAHLPNLTAIEFFLRDVWPLLDRASLHVIAGKRHDYYLAHYRYRAAPHFDQPGIELEGFVSDVRPAYRHASIAILPLVASAGTNIKVLEAMAAGKAIASTPAGVNGLDLAPGEEFLLTPDAASMADAINRLMDSPEECRRLGLAARRRAETEFGWDAIARRQADLYRELARQ